METKDKNQKLAETSDALVAGQDAERAESFAFMTLAESTFNEWDNVEDEIYDSL